MTNWRVERGRSLAEAQEKDYRTIVSYRPLMNAITQRVTATILLQQIYFHWKSPSVNRRPFYKFREPCGHKLYKDGDSWTEELAFSSSEFDTALKTIGTKITRGVSKTEVLAKQAPTSLVIYWTDSDRVTWYQLNEDLFLNCQDLAYHPELWANSTLWNYLISEQSPIPNTDAKADYPLSEITFRDLDSPSESQPLAGADSPGVESLGESAPKPKRRITEWERKRWELAEQFTASTGIAVPKRGQGVFKHRESMWWQPLRTVYDTADEDVARAKQMIVQAVAYNRAEKLAIVSPASIEKIVIAQAAEMPQKGAGMTAW